MNAIKFIKNHGVDKAREVVSGAPEWAIFWISRNQYHGSVITFPNMTDHYSVDLVELKRLVESVDLVEGLGGLEGAKTEANNCRYYEYADMTHRARLIYEAIADYEAIYSNDVTHELSFGISLMQPKDLALISADMSYDTETLDHIENHISPNCEVNNHD